MTTKPKLTVLDQDLEAKVARTPRGMAFWAGTGPEGKTCRECKFFTFNGYKSSRGMKGGLLKNGRCQKFTSLALMEGPPISYELSACKHFEQNPTPPTTINPRK